jgi:uncharacterized protein involved in type VI secretion and phage assembly
MRRADHSHFDHDDLHGHADEHKAVRVQAAWQAGQTPKKSSS